MHGTFPRPVLLAKTLDSIATSLLPFINIWFSALILSELVGGQGRERLIFLAALVVALNLILQCTSHLLKSWKNYCEHLQPDLTHNMYTNKIFSMDYADAQNADIRKEFSELLSHQRSWGFGFRRLLYFYDEIIRGAVQLIVSAGLAFSLFTLRVPEGSSYAFLDSAWMYGLVGLVLCCLIFLAPYINTVGGKVWMNLADDNMQVNRMFDYHYARMLSPGEKAKDIRIYKQQKRIMRDVAGIADMTDFLRAEKKFARFAALAQAVTYTASGLIFLYIALKAYAGAFDVGGIVLYVGAITQFSNGLSTLNEVIGEIKNNNPFLERAFKFLDIPNKKYQGTIHIEKRADIDYAIEFHNVSFKYPGSESYALKNLNLTLSIGKRMAVVGENGSGKTTMIKLLTRLYDPTEGEITLNGIDIKKYNYDEYMAIFGVIFQDFELLPFSLGQNVATAVNYDANRVNEVLTISGFEERLKTLPAGLDTYLGKEFEESGVEMSGGESQKIALARALYKNAPFVILDEPTAALDPIAEYEVYTSFNEIVGNKTAVYISHRLASCRFCDDIAVFHEGELVQRGSHDALVADGSGKYHELWHAQAQYYTDGKGGAGFTSSLHQP
jgi:ATP-binding cassette subfamily B protein